MYFLLLTTLCFLFQVATPYKSSEEFKIEMEYIFKPRPHVDNSNTLNLNETRKEHDRKMAGGAQLPYLIIHIHVIKLAENEVRLRGIDNKGDVKLTKKIEEGKSYKLDLGYTDDIKDRVTPHEYNLYFLSEEKEKISQVHLLIMEDGTFMVNGEKRGKF